HDPGEVESRPSGDVDVGIGVKIDLGSKARCSRAGNANAGVVRAAVVADVDRFPRPKGNLTLDVRLHVERPIENKFGVGGGQRYVATIEIDHRVVDVEERIGVVISQVRD